MSAPTWAAGMPVTETRNRQGPRNTAGETNPPTADEQLQDLIETHDQSNEAHEYIRKLINDGLAAVGATPNGSGGWAYLPPGMPSATTDERGIAKLMGGTADYPTVPWASVTGKPTIPTQYSQLTGTVPQSALPPVALVEYLGAVSSQSNMLALTGQRGDWCTRTDQNMDYQLIADTSNVLASWRAMTYPAAPVSSVNGRTGAVTGLAEQTAVTSNATAINNHTSNTSNPHNLTKAQIGLGNVDDVSSANAPVSTPQQQALDLKANQTDFANSILPDDIDITPTANTTVSSTSGVDITGGSVTVNVPSSTARYRVFAIFDVQANAANATTGVFNGRLLIDGVAQAGNAISTMTVSGQRMTVVQQWTVANLAAGARVFKLNALVANTATYIVVAANSGLNIRRVRN